MNFLEVFLKISFWGETLRSVNGKNGAIICSAVGTIRGFSSNGEVEVVPATSGQGWILQPLVHGGVKCVSGKSVRLIVKTGFTNPATSTLKLSVLPVESQSLNSVT